MSKHAAGATIHKDESSPTGVYIPQNLEEALAELDKCLPAAAKEDIRAISRDKMHSFGIDYATGFYKNWNLEKGSRLTEYFKSIGVNSAPEMGELIMQSYWSRRHGLKKNLEQEIEQYRIFEHRWDNEQSVSVKLPTADLRTKLTSAVGTTIELGDLISKARVTLLVLSSESDTRLPEIKKALDSLRTEYNAELFSAFTILDADTDSFSYPPGGPDTPEAVAANARTSKTQRNSTRHKAAEPWTLRAEPPFFQEMDNLLSADTFSFIPILLIKNDGTVVKLLRQYSEDNTADVLTAFRTYLNQARDANQRK